MKNNFVSVGKILNFHGVRGEAKFGYTKGREDFLLKLDIVYIQINNEYKEFEEKEKGRSKEQSDQIAEGMMALFTEFGLLMKEGKTADSEDAQAQVKKLQEYITEHFYTCTPKILAGLGKMYNGGGSMTENIDKFGGEGTADFAAKAIEVYCK